MEVLSVEPTPNPNAKKFVLATPLPAGLRLSFFNAMQAGQHPLGVALFAIDGVAGVLCMNDFVTVTKQPQAAWPAITKGVKAALKKSTDFVGSAPP